MNVKNFLDSLPQSYKNFGDPSINPKYDDNYRLKAKLDDHPLPNLLKLVDTAINCLEDEEVYCEINSDFNQNLLSSLINYPKRLAYYINENDSDKEINNNLMQLNLEEQVCVYEGHCDSFLQELKDIESEDKIGICYFNGVKDYRSQLLYLMSLRTFLADEAIIILNIEQAEIKQAVSDFLSFHFSPQLQSILISNPENQSPLNLGQDILILAWQNDMDSLLAKRVNNRGLTKLNESDQDNQKILLHVGCGSCTKENLPKQFHSEDWIEIRLDIDLGARPDIVGTITDLSGVPDNSVNAVFSSHNLEHIYNFEVPLALAEFKRVLKPQGFAMITLPDIEEVSKHVAQGNLETPLYTSPAGPITAIDIMYGLGISLAQGNYYMAHKTAFTDDTLKEKLVDTGFKDVKVTKGNNFDLWAVGYK